MNQVLNVVSGINIPTVPCPFCGGKPQWISVSGDDFIIRCADCHASTQHARMKPEDAAADWVSGNVVDDNFTITADNKIDEYLKVGVSKILLSEYSDIEQFPTYNGGFLCDSAVIITKDTILSVEPYGSILLYDDLSAYGRDYYKRSITTDDEKIEFNKSVWTEEHLLKELIFNVGDKKIVLKSESSMDCMAIEYK